MVLYMHCLEAAPIRHHGGSSPFCSLAIHMATARYPFQKLFKEREKLIQFRDESALERDRILIIIATQQ